eukprot:3877930-Rhodomonas_salina.1
MTWEAGVLSPPKVVFVDERAMCCKLLQRLSCRPLGLDRGALRVADLTSFKASAPDKSATLKPISTAPSHVAEQDCDSMLVDLSSFGAADKRRMLDSSRLSRSPCTRRG